MKTSKLVRAAALSVPLLLTACASPQQQPPMSFHDTRLQYALVAGDSAALRQDFNMKLPPSWAERAAAGFVLPVTVVTDALFWPAATGIKALAPSQQASSP